MVPTGIPALDGQTGGIPRGALSQICAPGLTSSGKTTLLLSLLSRLTAKGEFCALVDASDCFDPASAELAGVHLSRLLWVRCAAGQKLKPIEQAFKAADIVLQNGGFGLIAVDLGNMEERLVRKIPLTTWFRFARVVEKTPVALVFLSPIPAAQSCAALTVQMRGENPVWIGESKLSHSQYLSHFDFEVEVLRARTRKPTQSERRYSPAMTVPEGLHNLAQRFSAG
jgi:hypothetical protein